MGIHVLSRNYIGIIFLDSLLRTSKNEDYTAKISIAALPPPSAAQGTSYSAGVPESPRDSSESGSDSSLRVGNLKRRDSKSWAYP